MDLGPRAPHPRVFNSDRACENLLLELSLTIHPVSDRYGSYMQGNTRSRQPVIADVAKLAGVSVPTVSRVLTGSVPVSPTRKKLVLDAIAELGYRPNAAARALVKGRQHLIAVFVGNTTHYGYARTIQGVEEAARQAGYAVVIAVIDSDKRAAVEQAVSFVLEQPVAGALVLEYDAPGIATRKVLPEHLPIASVAGIQSGPGPRAAMDDRIGAKNATEYLLELGHQTVHHVAIPTQGGANGRAAGWREALLENGRRVPEIITAGWEPMAGYEAGKKLARLDDCTAVLCGNDELAIGVMRALVEVGKKIPDDVSVIGFDDQPLAEMWIPALTTVAQDFVQLGREAFGLLHGLILNSGDPVSVLRSPQLIVRDSTSQPRRD